MQNVVIPDRDPAAGQRPQAVSQRSGGVHRHGAGSGEGRPACPPRPATRRKAEADEGSPRLVGGEVGSLKACQLTDDLLGWKPPGADDHIVACDGLGIDSSHGTDDVAAAQNERVPRDPDFSDCRHLCHGNSLEWFLWDVSDREATTAAHTVDTSKRRQASDRSAVST